jgi:acetolactate synthase-1/2/3 large subunit
MGYADGALNKAVHSVFPQADVVLVLGKRIDYRLALGGPRLFSSGARFIQVDIHPQELGANRSLTLGICADVRKTLECMLEVLGKARWKDRSAWLRLVRAEDRKWRRELDHHGCDSGSPPHPAALFQLFRHILPAETLYSWDGGDFVHWGRAILPAQRAGGWLRLGPLGTIGSSLPNAVALQLANPRAPVVAVTGDGSLGFYLAELDTIVRYGLPVVIIVGNDAGWGLERELQRELCGTTVACELRASRYDLVMKGFGGEGETVELFEELELALRRALASRRPYLLNIRIRPFRSPFTDWQLAGKR